MKRLVAAVAAVAAFAIGIGACSDDGPGPGEGRLAVDGVALVRSDGDERRVTGDEDVRPGDEVEMVQGTAVLELANGVVLELRDDAVSGRPSNLRMDDVPTLLGGDLLAVAGGDTPARVSTGGTSLRVDDGVARVSRALDVQVGVYAGSLAVLSAAEESDVPALFEVAVPALGLVSSPVPLQLDGADPWDRRMLGEVIQLSAELDRRSAGFTSQAGAAARQPGFYLTRFEDLAGAEDVVRTGFRPSRPAGEQLIGTAIVALGREGTVGERYDRVFSFRADGASWGLVARREGVSRGPLLERVDGVIAGPGTELALSTPGGGTGSPPPTPTPTTAAPPPEGGPGPAPGPGPSPTPPPTEPPPEGPDGPIPPTGTPVDPIVEPVDDLLGGLLPEESDSADPGILPPTGTPLDPIVEPVDDLIGGLLG